MSKMKIIIPEITLIHPVNQPPKTPEISLNIKLETNDY